MLKEVIKLNKKAQNIAELKVTLQTVCDNLPEKKPSALSSLSKTSQTTDRRCTRQTLNTQ